MNFPKTVMTLLIFSTASLMANTELKLSLNGPGSIAPGSSYSCKATVDYPSNSSLTYCWVLTPSDGSAKISPNGDTAVFTAGKNLGKYELNCTVTSTSELPGNKVEKSKSAILSIVVAQPEFELTRESADTGNCISDNSVDTLIYWNIDNDSGSGKYDKDNTDHFIDDELTELHFRVKNGVFANKGTYTFKVNNGLRLWVTKHRYTSISGSVSISLSDSMTLSKAIIEHHLCYVESTQPGTSSITYAFKNNDANYEAKYEANMFLAV